LPSSQGLKEGGREGALNPGAPKFLPCIPQSKGFFYMESGQTKRFWLNGALEPTVHSAEPWNPEK